MPGKPDTALAAAILRAPELAASRLRHIAWEALKAHPNNRDAAKKHLIDAIKSSRDFDLAWAFFEFATATAANRELDEAWADWRHQQKKEAASPDRTMPRAQSPSPHTPFLTKSPTVARPVVPTTKVLPATAKPPDPRSRAARALSAKASTVKLSILSRFEIRGVLLGEVSVIDARGWLATETLALRRITRDTRFVSMVVERLTDTGRIKDHYRGRESEVDAMWEEVNREMAA